MSTVTLSRNVIGRGFVGRWLAVFLLCWLFAAPALAVDPLVFENDSEARRHQELSAVLRCLVCQNQSLADSDAPLAQDLRREVLDLMRQGMNDQEIKDYLVNRYSDFVLYDPPVNPNTFLLWFGPLLLVVVALFVVYRSIRRQQQLQNDNDNEAREHNSA